jgi:hypothetical protein
MTIEQCVADHLEENGMWPDDVPTVIALIKEEMKDTMERRWGDDIAAYPPGMKQTVLLVARSVAYKWLEENQPHAWFLPMVAQTSPG